MANLLGQNIGTNYKGILNLNTLNGNLSGTLQAVTDGDGNASPLQLSTTEVKVNSELLVNGRVTSQGSSGSGVNGFQLLNGDNTTTIFRLTRNGEAGVVIQSLANVSFSVNNAFSNTSYEMQLTSAGNLVIGTTTASARLHVRAAAASIAGRFEDSAGIRILEIGNGGYNLIIGNNNDRLTGSSNSGYFEYNTNANGHDFIKQNAYAGSGTVSGLRLNYSINNHAGTVNGILVNATETSITGTTHNLMDLQVGGVSQFRVSRTGLTTANGFQSLAYNESFQRIGLNNGANFNSLGYILAQSNGVFRLTNASENGFDRLQFGANSASSPALRVNGANLEVVLANATAGSGFTGLQASQFTSNLFVGTTSGRMDFRGQYDISIAGGFTGGVGGVAISEGSNATPNASALLDVSSTTRGFLPPRMTTAQRDLIGTPAAGLMIYNTSTNRPNFYDGSAWVAL